MPRWENRMRRFGNSVTLTAASLMVEPLLVLEPLSVSGDQ